MSFANTMRRKLVSRNIRKYRELRFPGLGGKTKCAVLLNVSLQQWSHWEHGRRAPSAKNLKSIAEVLGISEDALWVDESMTDDNATVIAIMEGMREFLEVMAHLLMWRNAGRMRMGTVEKIRDYALNVIAEAEADGRRQG
ncbi:MAG: helix-turn-helix domain-containing protein [Planctomycetota bacterium]|jgi:transcriptional regulator with XRE-family HTH domain|nr:helix-turn-helix domain-containing protein [Planctomycetota bacterium]